MAPKYVSYYERAAQSSRSPERTASPWWRPLTNAWGIFGLIIFIGHCHAASGLRSRWRFGSQGDEENQLSWLPLSARDQKWTPDLGPAA
jgi:hypothetical protein